VLANQSIAQLSERLQVALGNAQTIVSFRISRSDADALARVLGQVDISAIKREGQTDVQHPIYSPLNEQWEGFIQHLTNLKVRQAVAKTADDRLASIWSEKIKAAKISEEALEKQIVSLLKRYSHFSKILYQTRSNQTCSIKDSAVFSY